MSVSASDLRLLRRRTERDVLDALHGHSDATGGLGTGPATSPIAFIAGAALAVDAVMLGTAGAVELASSGTAPWGLFGLAVVVGVLGLSLMVRWRLPDDTESAEMLASIAVVFANSVAVSTAAYLLGPTPLSATESVLESLSGFTTTALTVVKPQDLGPGMQLWRSLTQWSGGLLMLVLVTAIIPSYAPTRRSGSDLTPRGDFGAGRIGSTIRRAVKLYVALTLLLSTGFVLAGMHVWDSVNHAMTTASTGGFSVRDGNIGAYGSAAVEWVALLGMFAAGLGTALLWSISHGRLRRLPSRSEPALFSALIGFGVATVLLTDGTGLGHEQIRHATFGVVSAVSTTGFVVERVSEWSEISQAVALALMSVGAMSGSIGGGFKVRRLLILIQVARRELFLAVHHRAVRVIRLDDEVISEETVGRTLAYQSSYIVLAGVGAFFLALLGVDLVDSLSGAVSALGTVGPGLGQLADASYPEDGGRRTVLAALMVLGRVEIFPVLTLGGIAGARARRLTGLGSPRTIVNRTQRRR